ncbi:MAG: hypothetical protein IBX44_00565 [Sulfurospirillum sp.]|nr:hypothetical protein [Sulfurospirillum sp.]
MQENFPQFFNDVAPIILYDPLAEILGSVKGGIIKFNYKQIVKAAGHSCPTVAGAYLTCKRALEVLYPDSLPLRGGIQVEFKDSLTQGVTGVISNVISNITGATKESGFKGINGNFARHSLMDFGVAIDLHVRFIRVDTNASVQVAYDPSCVPPSAKLQALMPKVMSLQASAEEKGEFGKLWQERVKKILIDNAKNDKMVTLKQG